MTIEIIDGQVRLNGQQIGFVTSVSQSQSFAPTSVSYLGQMHTYAGSYGQDIELTLKLSHVPPSVNLSDFLNTAYHSSVNPIVFGKNVHQTNDEMKGDYKEKVREILE